jgi:hypothetical protein
MHKVRFMTEVLGYTQHKGQSKQCQKKKEKNRTERATNHRQKGLESAPNAYKRQQHDQIGKD